jgi:hypothetical protein
VVHGFLLAPHRGRVDGTLSRRASSHERPGRPRAVVCGEFEKTKTQKRDAAADARWQESLTHCTALGSMWREKRVLARSRPPRRAEREAHAIYRREDRRRPQRAEHARRSQTRARPLDSLGRRPGAPRARARRDRAFFRWIPRGRARRVPRVRRLERRRASPPPPFSA